jgi:orotate phosphoribosyltransferase
MIALLVKDKKMNYDELHFWTKNYIEKNCLIKNRVMPGKLPGTTYTWIFYLRNGLFNHEFLSAVSQMFIQKVKHEIGHFDFQISGLETGSTPLLAGIPLIGRVFDLNINSFSIRKEQKTYGLLNWIEGMPNEKPVMLIDDLCNSSMSMKKSYDILQEEKIPVFNYAFSIINKVNKNIHKETRVKSDMYLPEDIKMIYLFDLDDFNLENPSH